MSWKPSKNQWKRGSQACSLQVFSYNSNQMMAVGDITNSHTLMVQMHLLYQRSGDYIHFSSTPLSEWLLKHWCTIMPFSSIHVLITLHNYLWEDTPQRFEMKQIIFRPNSDTFSGIFRHPWQKNKSWHKTDCFNVLSDFFNCKSVAPSCVNFWRQSAPRQSCRQVQEFWKKNKNF